MKSDIVQVIASDDRRGAEVFAVNLHDALVRRGRQVRTVALVAGGSGAPLAVPHLGTRPLGPATVLDLRRLAAGTPSVVAHGSTTLPACAISLGGRGAGFVYRSIGDPAFWRSSAVRRWRVGLLLRRARTVVALWPGAADTLIRHGLEPGRVTVIPNAVPASQFPLITSGDRAAARSSFPALDAAGEAVVACVGSLSPDKRVDLAILAVARLPEAHLLVVGDGPLGGQLRRLGAEVAPGRVHFLGTLADPSLALALADVLVLASATEGMPAVLIEAGMRGLPVVATDVGAVAEVVVPGVTGLVVRPGDPAALAAALRQAITDPLEAGVAARAHCVARFDIDVVAAAWDELLRAP